MFYMFIYYHTKCSHIKIHLNALLLFRFLLFGVNKIETSVMNYQMCAKSFFLLSCISLPQNKIQQKHKK